jgi:hypothetical protein
VTPRSRWAQARPSNVSSGGIYREETRTLVDGRVVPVFVLTNGTASRRFLLTNQDDYSLTYNGLVTAVEKRYSSGWYAFASYTWSRTDGLQPSSGGAAADAQSSSTIGGTFGRDPNSLTNANGRLPNDRPHMFCSAVSWEVRSTKPRKRGWLLTTCTARTSGSRRSSLIRGARCSALG